MIASNGRITPAVGQGGAPRLSFALFSLLLVCFAYTFPRWADPNQNSRLDMVIAVVEDGTFQIDRFVANTVDYARVGVHYYSDKAPGVAFLGMPVYMGLDRVLDLPIAAPLTQRLENNAAFRGTLRAEGSGVQAEKVRFALTQVVLSLVLAALPSALMGVLLYRLLTRLGITPWLGAAAVLTYGLLTPAFAYANAFYGHQLSAALLLAAFYLVFPGSAALTPQRLVFVGLLLAYSVITEYPALLIAGILGLYTLRRLIQQGRGRAMVWLVLGGVMVVAPWMAYNNAIFGGPLALGYSNSELWVSEHGTGFMSLTWPRGEALWGITFGLFRGLFVLSPVLLLALPGLWLWWHSRRYRDEFWVVLASLVAFFGFNASSGMWWGGFAMGPRYLLPVLPFMALPLAIASQHWLQRPWFRVLVVLLAMWSLVATWGLALAGQAFPSDTLRNPLLEYALPHWVAGNVARNWGTLLGLPGAWSLLPLAAAAAAIVLLYWLAELRGAARRLASPSRPADAQQSMAGSV